MPQSSFDKNPLYILDALRTPVASPFKSLKDFSAPQLGGIVIQGLLKRTRLNPDCISEVILGNTVSAGSGQNPARQASFCGGLNFRTTAYTVNAVCASGLQALILAGQAICFGSKDCIIAVGAESATRTPLLFSKDVETPYSERTPIDSLMYDGLWCNLSGQLMGQLCESLAKREKISRPAQDAYAFESHRKAAGANFSNEIVSVVLSDGKKFSVDEHIRRHVNLESFKILSPAFGQNGTLSAGNVSLPCDGAAAVLVAGKDFVRRQEVRPLARIVGFASIALNPKEVFKAAVPAVEACLQACGLKLKDIDLFEVSEAFAAQAIYTRDKLDIATQKMNIYGGDIALGHPLGAAGLRILVTLAHALKAENKRYGLGAICYGGGGAMAIVLENDKFVIS